MKYFFKYQGLVRDLAVFTIITDDEFGQRMTGIDICYYHYKVDEKMNVQKVSYMDQDLGKCNASEYRSNGVVVPSRSEKVTESQAKSFLDALIEQDVELPLFGKISKLPLQLIKNFPCKISFPNGSVKFKYYDGIDENDALKKARINNKVAETIEIYDGEMTGKLTL